MASKKSKGNNKQPVAANVSKQRVLKPGQEKTANDWVARLSGFRIQALVIAAIAFIFYCNTFSNEFALDDVMVIQQNDYVHEGFSGIPKILSSDNEAAFYKHNNAANQFSGGRYRPLSIITFAIEEELLGKEADENPALGQTVSEHARLYMHTRHVVNVILYMLSAIVFLYLLRYIVFKQSPWAAFTAAILFTIHPIHTEVVANIKSRDEILSFLFICLCLIYAYRYKENNKGSTLALALTCYALALFSKEYAINLVIVIPILFYLFKGYTIKDSLKASLPYLLILAGYLFVRFSVVSAKVAGADTDLQNNPYLYASGFQKIATEVATLLNYLKLLFFPYPLSADYSYSQIPYNDLRSLKFWISVAVHAGLVIWGIQLFRKRNVLSFAIAFYLINLLMVSNLFINLGATMGERLIYHSSAGFAIGMGWLLYKAAEKMNAGHKTFPVLAIIMIVFTGLCGYEVNARNADWKNTNTLFIKDVQTVPNSFLANGIAGVGYCALSEDTANKNERMELLKKGVSLLSKSIDINNKYVNGYYNRALAYNILGEWDKELKDLDSVKKLKDTYPALAEQYLYLYHDKGFAALKQRNYDEAIAAFDEGCKLAPKDPEMWYLLGITYYGKKDYQSAIKAWDVTLQLNPNHTAAKNAYAAAQKFIAQGNQK